MSKKKFFSGNSLRQALIAAAAHFDVSADEIAYREVEKKTGFLKVRKRVVIEVDVDDPRRAPAAPAAAPAEEEPTGERLERGEATEAGEADLAADPSRRRPPRLPRRADAESQWGGAGDRTKAARGNRAGEGEEDEAAESAANVESAEDAQDEEAVAAPSRGRARRPRRRREEEEPTPVARQPQPAVEDEEEASLETKDDERDDAADQDRDDEADDWRDRDDEGDEDGDDDRDEDGDEGEEEPPAAPPASRAATRSAAPTAGDETGGNGRRRRRRRGGRGRSGAGERGSAAPAGESDDLVALPDRPRRASERFSEARGPLADAARDALDRVLDVAGLDLSYTVLQGDDRLEIDLTGRDEALLVAEGGELLRAIEHLVPRAVRSLAGESVNVRVDAADFHEIHEEQLRTLAQRVAGEVRRSERPRTLEPMSPADRRIVHITLADEPRVTSMSEGSGYFKRIVVKPA